MGRPKGSKNRVTATVKDNILAVYEKVGGRDGMARWAKANPDAFYQMYGRLAPKEVIADVDANLTVELVSYLDVETESDTGRN